MKENNEMNEIDISSLVERLQETRVSIMINMDLNFEDNTFNPIYAENYINLGNHITGSSHGILIK